MDILNIIASVSWTNVFYAARDVFIVVDILLFVLAIFLIIVSQLNKPKFDTSKVAHYEIVQSLKGNKELKERWGEIIKKSDMRPPQSYSLAIIEADTFISSLLSKIGIDGRTMKEKLDKLDPDEITTLKTLWRVHRIRNMLVHTPGFKISKKQAEEVLNGYETFLKELEIL